jgi:hypothetical protein
MTRTERWLRRTPLVRMASLSFALGACSLNPQPLPPGTFDGSAGIDGGSNFDKTDGGHSDTNPIGSPTFDGGTEGGAGSGEAGLEEGGDAGFGDSGLGDAPGEAGEEASTEAGLDDGGTPEGSDQ